MNTEAVWAYERQRLQRTLREVNEQLKQARALVSDRKESVVGVRQEMWIDLPKVIRDFDDAVNFYQLQQLLDQQEREYLIYRRLIPRFERLLASAYFGRIDFRREGEEDVAEVYVGIASLVEQNTGVHLIYDWRAPISSLFYDFERGPGHFDTAEGRVHGSILLKRQYKIEGDRLVYFFDTDLKIDDDLLQSILGRTASPKMRTIVQSIQREQNRAIRDERHDLLVVSGPAGSGKTSIALHRIAYLLYRQRERLHSKNVVIISPNDVFSDYISRVLPDLGEENVRQVTFAECVKKYLKGLTVESISDQLESLHGGGLARRGAQSVTPAPAEDATTAAEDAAATTGATAAATGATAATAAAATAPGDLRAAEISLKGSVEFYHALQAYARRLTRGDTIPFENVTFRGSLVITKDEILTLLRETYAYLPYRNRLEKIKRRILYLLQPYEQERLEELKRMIGDDPDEVHFSAPSLARRARELLFEETRPIREKLDRWAQFDPLAAYAGLFRRPMKELLGAPADTFDRKTIEAICAATRRRIGSGRLAYEDVAPFVTLRALLGDVEPLADVKHVVIDEAQDYSLLHYEAIKHLFPQATFTVLGDPDQSIHPYLGTADLGAVSQVLGKGRTAEINLNISYRSTREIARFARGILPREGVTVVDRGGEKPRLIKLGRASSRAEAARAEVSRWLGMGYELIAVICKTAAEATAAHAAIQASAAPTTFQLITSPDDELHGGVVVLPAYLAKGLEFDGVLIYDAGATVYARETERKLLYTACTRALHSLSLLVHGELSPLFSGVDPGSYEVVPG